MPWGISITFVKPSAPILVNIAVFLRLLATLLHLVPFLFQYEVQYLYVDYFVHTSVLLIHYFVLTHPATDALGWWQTILTSHTVAHRRLNPFLLAIAHFSFILTITRLTRRSSKVASM